MAGTVTSAGLGSGLPIGDLVKSLVDSDKSAKTNQIAKQTTLNTTKLSGISTLNSALDAFQTALTNLGKTDTPAFNGFSATSSAPTVLTVTAKNTAVAGTYAVEVVKLATSSSVASASFDTAAASAIPSGSLTITQNSVDTQFNIPEGSTLQSVRDLINSKTSTSGVSANIITDATGSRLVFGSTKTGAGSDITTSSSVSGLTIGSGALDASDATSAGRIGDAPIDGEIKVGGLSIKSSTNTYDTAVSGLSFTAVAETKTPTVVTVGANSDGLKTSLQAFVDAYNTVVSTINSLTKATTDSNGDLTGVAALGGDSLARDLLATIRSVLNDTSSGGKLSTLSQLGIQTDQVGGKLAFDTGKYTAAMAKGLGGDVQQLFAGTKEDGSDGLLKRMSKALDPYTSTGGVMDVRTTQLNKTKADLLAQKAALDLRVETLTATLTAKYNAMDLAVGQMKSTLSSITSFFDALNARTSAS
ncbi:flagellar filament capping protein FliD [Pseudomonas phytophila]|uniref:Flagellar hook-associated protein 2 n=1 Tax=Pseudomonas phytophila TaxID=2867264 RepID=A0ABY6FAF0_9PSED|nr:MULTISPECIES: flagellar filament capping protein FliD [Pseudomonas]MCQ2995522.1 flagellar filament capping protein FliD [Pseudomonas syringae]MCD5979257.1 flagellar filament capping protein FliD [Pseudomonas quasicaspiana]MCD5991406.1 flagellar filament capping protein FliD [Pseudomonas quasicaspiana]MCQ3033993.1 flagellar filament capping protein FliD [Pseudomonas syringae]MDG6403581.1 flagellar filament capping protein FliD [Pseudomonas quasicaspiana]